jgi:hypothetical protein
MTRLEYYKKYFPGLVGFRFRMSASERLAYVKTTAGKRWLSEVLTPEELDAASEILCDSAPRKTRSKYPIIDSYEEFCNAVQTQELTEDMQ